MSPKFSIILTSYNRSRLLVRALNSLIHQTFDDWEGIIVDDGSTDDTPEVVCEFLKNHSNIRYFRQENHGEAGAKNTGFSMCRGNYISFLDSDDEYHPKHLESRNELLCNNPGVQLLHGGVSIIGDEFVPDRKNPGNMIHLSDCIIGGTFFVEQNAMKLLGGFRNIPIGTDSDLYERAVSMNFKIMKTHMPSYIYHRTGQDSITHNFLKNSFKH
ncbi:MAG: glycosyltransferase family 2 protein [Weeksellaceae bacterium]|jgi:glycosyltransferase involved in cell wall biosynthesis|nr:glycosyltransferase family 2 protein [Weeksellaceae bacterium]